ncbi:actin cytoskeleton-regulatory complex protein sla1 [Xylogone sp. PMI_703]|nr:actin cytoskeleton-regulatory complex protein sla1 [Xylogone sp. PMI_703]
MGFLGVYKAIYDYSPNGEGELDIKDGDILYVLEKGGDDGWWKAKKKAAGEDDDEPVGLIPNNYIEEAQPTHKARALYDYTRQTDEELSFKEDAQLQVFDTSDPDWILVGLDDEYGFAPANYIEVQEGSATPAAAPAAPAPPSLPQRPVQVEEEEPEPPSESPSSPVQTPAAAIAGIMRQRNASISSNPAPPTPTRPTVQFTPEESDEEEPKPALPSRSRSTSSPRIASPAYAPSYESRDRDEDAPQRNQGGFHLYNISEMISVLGKKKKMPTTLGINTATGVILVAPEKLRDGPEQTWTAEKMTHYSIEGKHIFLDFVRPSKSYDFHAGAKDTAEEIVSALGELAGAVRAEGLREIISAGTGQTQKKGQMLYDFMAQGEDEVTVAVGDEVIILDDSKSEEWWQVRRLKNGKEGVVPSSYVEITGTVQVSDSGIKSIIEQNRLEEERLAKESIKAARREEDTRGSEVGPGMRLPERGSSLSARDNGNTVPQQRNNRDSHRDSGASRNTKSKPDPTKVRTWTDRSKSFSVEAQFLALKEGKIHLHKMNGVKIAVPVSKMSIEDLEYVERLTGVSLDEDKPLSEIKKSRSPNRTPPNESRPSGGAGATVQKKPEYDWFQFFLSCDVAVGLCDRYAQAFARDSMDESVLPDVDSTVLRTLGLREGDIIKVMRFLDNKYGRNNKNKRNVSFGGEEVIEGEAGLFSGPGGALKNNTRKGRPAPAVQTSDVVDPKAFTQETKETSPKLSEDRVATPLASAPPPAKKEASGGFDDDAWDVKPSKQPESTPAPAAAPAAEQAPVQPQRPRPPSAPQQPALTGALQELSLLSPPLEPTKTQPPPAPQQPQITLPPPQQPQPQAPQPTGASPAFFAGVNQQPTGFQPQLNLTQQQQQQNIARARPPPAQFPQTQNSLLLPQPPARPLSAPQAGLPSTFAPPPLAPQMTGFQSSAGFQPQVAPPGQSLNDLRLQQQFTAQQQQQQFQPGFAGPQNTGIPLQPTGFNQFTPGFQQFQPQPTGFPQQNTFQNGANVSPFADPRSSQLPPPIQPQATGFQSSFPQQQFPQATGVNSFLQPALIPQPTGINQQQQPGLNGFNQNQNFQPPPVPPIPQQQPAPLLPQKTGPPPPVRFGISPDAKKLAPQPTGRRANLAQATPENPFGF